MAHDDHIVRLCGADEPDNIDPRVDSATGIRTRLDPSPSTVDLSAGRSRWERPRSRRTSRRAQPPDTGRGTKPREFVATEHPEALVVLEEALDSAGETRYPQIERAVAALRAVGEVAQGWHSTTQGRVEAPQSSPLCPGIEHRDRNPVEEEVPSRAIAVHRDPDAEARRGQLACLPGSPPTSRLGRRGPPWPRESPRANRPAPRSKSPRHRATSEPPSSSRQPANRATSRGGRRSRRSGRRPEYRTRRACRRKASGGKSPPLTVRNCPDCKIRSPLLPCGGHSTGRPRTGSSSPCPRAPGRGSGRRTARRGR